MLKISIITVCFNSARTIRDAINSVLSQTYPDIEYIIIDGASQDDTIEIIKSYGERITHFLSEPDQGIYDAMNKGIALASGDIVGILNSDDFYATNDVLEKVIELFTQEPVDAVYGDLDYVNAKDTNKIVRKWRSGEFKAAQFKHGWMPAHPTFFVKRDLYLRYGGFTNRLKSAADYEFILRVLYVHRCTASYLPQVLVKMRMGGQSNASFKNILLSNYEFYKAWTINGITPNIFSLFVRKIFSKLKQFF